MVAVALGVYIIADVGATYRAKSTARLAQLWQKDIDNLQFAHKLPAYWTEIRLVERYPANDDVLASLWSKTVSLPVEVNPQGEYKLEVRFRSQKNEAGVIRAVIEHGITHIPSNNYVWELGRTYVIE